MGKKRKTKKTFVDFENPWVGIPVLDNNAGDVAKEQVSAEEPNDVYKKEDPVKVTAVSDDTISDVELFAEAVLVDALPPVPSREWPEDDTADTAEKPGGIEVVTDAEQDDEIVVIETDAPLETELPSLDAEPDDSLSDIALIEPVHFDDDDKQEDIVIFDDNHELKHDSSGGDLGLPEDLEEPRENAEPGAKLEPENENDIIVLDNALADDVIAVNDAVLPDSDDPIVVVEDGHPPEEGTGLGNERTPDDAATADVGLVMDAVADDDSAKVTVVEELTVADAAVVVLAAEEEDVVGQAQDETPFSERIDDYHLPAEEETTGVPSEEQNLGEPAPPDETPIAELFESTDGATDADIPLDMPGGFSVEDNTDDVVVVDDERFLEDAALENRESYDDELAPEAAVVEDARPAEAAESIGDVSVGDGVPIPEASGEEVLPSPEVLEGPSSTSIPEDLVVLEEKVMEELTAEDSPSTDVNRVVVEPALPDETLTTPTEGGPAPESVSTSKEREHRRRRRRESGHVRDRKEVDLHGHNAKLERRKGEARVLTNEYAKAVDRARSEQHKRHKSGDSKEGERRRPSKSAESEEKPKERERKTQERHSKLEEGRTKQRVEPETPRSAPVLGKQSQQRRLSFGSTGGSSSGTTRRGIFDRMIGGGESVTRGPLLMINTRGSRTEITREKRAEPDKGHREHRHSGSGSSRDDKLRDDRGKPGVEERRNRDVAYKTKRREEPTPLGKLGRAVRTILVG